MRMSVLTIILLALVTMGCASSSDLDKKAHLQTKAGNYYNAIGQPQAAKEAYSEADKNRKRADSVISIIVEVFNHIREDG